MKTAFHSFRCVSNNSKAMWKNGWQSYFSNSQFVLMGRHICLLQPNKNEERKRTRRNTIKTCFENYSKTKRYLVSFRKRKRDCCPHVSKRFVFYQLTTIIHCFVVRDKFNNFRKKNSNSYSRRKITLEWNKTNTNSLPKIVRTRVQLQQIIQQLLTTIVNRSRYSH